MRESFAQAMGDDRAVVVEELSRARAEGRLTAVEFEERLRAVSEARTFAELRGLVADLPGGVPVVVGRRSGVFVKVLGRAWLVASVINFAVWGIVGLSLGEALYPWWVWVVVPWGLVVAVARFGRSG